MRQTIPRKRGEDRVPFNLLLPISVDSKLRAFVDASEGRETLTSVAIRGIEEIVSDEKTVEKTETKPAPKPRGVTFDLNELDQKELARLAEDTLKLDDPNLFARLVIRKALDMGPDVMREFLLGQAKREVAAKMEETNAERADAATTKSTPQKRAKKVA